MIRIDNVTKRFGDVTAVDEVSLEVREGEIFALLGPNGAGKTTLIRMIVGMFRPDSGSIVHAWAATPGERRRAMGYLPEERGLYQDMSVLRTLVYFGELHGMSQRAAAHAARPWLERLGLTGRAGDAVKTLSKGNQQKVQFAAAILHTPRLAILDEPFSGLDPVNQDAFVDLIKEIRSGGTSVVLSAHQMPLVERLADRIFLVNRGREVLHGTIGEIRERWQVGDRLVLHLAAAADASFLAAHPSIDRVEQPAPSTVRLRLRPGAPMSDLLQAAASRLDIASIRTETANLHEIYVATVAGAEPR
jgi:ABC-2 type transport system ATP-binding protein